MTEKEKSKLVLIAGGKKDPTPEELKEKEARERRAYRATFKNCFQWWK